MSKAEQSAVCECGQVDYELKAQPLIRLYCHCTICQAFNQAPYADICIFKGRDVALPADELVRYKAWQSPKIVQRGVCTSCEKPIVEQLTMPLMSGYVIAPTHGLQNKTLIPEAALHMFYHSRVQDADDDLPKYSGYLKSQLGLLRRLYF